MDMNKLNGTLREIKMSDEAVKRIAEKCAEEEIRKNNGNLYYMEHGKKAPKTGRKIFRITAAAVLVLCSATAVLAGSGIFKNPSIMGSIEEIMNIENSRDDSGPRSFSVEGPGSPTPHTLEEMTESRRYKSDGWTSMDTIGGSVSGQYDWTDMEVIDNEGDLRERNVYSDKKDVKKEYTAKDPMLLQDLMKGEAHIDLAELNELYNYVPDANVLYYVEDKRGNYEELCFDSLYADSDGTSYFSIEYMNSAKARNGVTNNYIAKDSYDEVYKYVNPSGAEFIIQTYGDCVWATSSTEHSDICLYGGYMQTEEIEAVLDCISFEQ